MTFPETKPERKRRLRPYLATHVTCPTTNGKDLEIWEELRRGRNTMSKPIKFEGKHGGYFEVTFDKEKCELSVVSFPNRIVIVPAVSNHIIILQEDEQQKRIDDAPASRW